MTLSFRQCLRIKAHTRARETFWKHYDRESYECPCCGYIAQGIDREFDVHHIDGDWLNGHIFNLIGICYCCHKRVHRIRNRIAGLDAWKDRVNDPGQTETKRKQIIGLRIVGAEVMDA